MSQSRRITALALALLTPSLALASCSSGHSASEATHPTPANYPSSAFSNTSTGSTMNGSKPTSSSAGAQPTVVSTELDPGAPDFSGGTSRRTVPPLPDNSPRATQSSTRDSPNLGNSRYIQPITDLHTLPESPVLRSGYSGVKVDLLQRELGVDQRGDRGQLLVQTIDDRTTSAIKRWESAHGFLVDGTVSERQWEQMFPDVPWTVDHYREDPRLPLSASAAERIDTMINYAREQIGARYVWGGAGPRKYGFDCSGLLLQAMYAAGLDPEPINVVDHQRPNYPTAQKLYEYPGFKRVPASQAKRGDLIFYGPKEGTEVTHVALNVGDGYVLEAITSLGVSEDSFYTSFRGGKYVMRKYAVRVAG